MIKELALDKNLKADLFVQAPIVIKVTEFNEKAYATFSDDFQRAVDSGQSIIPISIDSYGGQVYALLGMLELIRTSPVPIATYVSTKAMSCGAVLFSAGTEGYRFISPNGTVLVHQVSSAAWGKVEDIVVSADHTVQLNKRLLGILSKNCGHASDYFINRLLENGNADLYYDAKTALKHNLANHIKTPTFKVSVKQVTSIEY